MSAQSCLHFLKSERKSERTSSRITTALSSLDLTSLLIRIWNRGCWKSTISLPCSQNQLTGLYFLIFLDLTLFVVSSCWTNLQSSFRFVNEPMIAELLNVVGLQVWIYIIVLHQCRHSFFCWNHAWCMVPIYITIIPGPTFCGFKTPKSFAGVLSLPLCCLKRCHSYWFLSAKGLGLSKEEAIGWDGISPWTCHVILSFFSQN